jgi:maleate isomerase
LELLSVASLPEDLVDTRNIYKLRTARVLEIFDQLELRSCDAVLLSGTGMPTVRLIAQLSLPVPVLSSNLCLAWALQCAVHAPKSESDVLAALLDVEAPWRGYL